jgi:hypothetical protein
METLTCISSIKSCFVQYICFKLDLNSNCRNGFELASSNLMILIVIVVIAVLIN